MTSPTKELAEKFKAERAQKQRPASTWKQKQDKRKAEKSRIGTKFFNPDLYKCWYFPRRDTESEKNL